MLLRCYLNALGMCYYMSWSLKILSELDDIIVLHVADEKNETVKSPRVEVLQSMAEPYSVSSSADISCKVRDHSTKLCQRTVAFSPNFKQTFGNKTRLHSSPGLSACQLGRKSGMWRLPSRNFKKPHCFEIPELSLSASLLLEGGSEFEAWMTSFPTAHSNSWRKAHSLLLLQHMFIQINHSNRGLYVPGMGLHCLGRFSWQGIQASTQGWEQS